MPGMRLPIPVALLGFTPFEREHLQAGLRAVRPAGPLYAVRLSAPAGCNLLVADGGNPAACQEVERSARQPCTVLVGAASASTLPDAAVRLPRPIQLPGLLQALDGLATAAPPISAEAAKVQDMLAHLLLRSRQRQRAEPAPVSSPEAAASPHAQAASARALLVGGEQQTRRWLGQALARADITLQSLPGGQAALALLQREVFDFVFLSGGEPAAAGGADSDGFHTCKLLQALPPASPGAPRPMLVLLLAGDLMIERLRAERAGADTWLVPPWSERELARVLQERQRWLQDLQQSPA